MNDHQMLLRRAINEIRQAQDFRDELLIIESYRDRYGRRFAQMLAKAVKVRKQ